MNYRERLTAALGEAFAVVSQRDDALVLADDGRQVEVIGTEDDIASLVTRLAHDGVAALGEVGGDTSGMSAGVGLLAIHLEELIASDPAVTRIHIRPSRLRPS